MNERLIAVLDRLEKKRQPDGKLHSKSIKHANLRKPTPNELTELLENGPLKKIQHALNREEKKATELKAEQYRKEKLFIPSDKDKEILRLLSKKIRSHFDISYEELGKKPEKKFSDEDLKRKIRRRIEKAPGPMESVSYSLISKNHYVELPERFNNLNEILTQDIVSIDRNGQININKIKAASLLTAFQKGDPDEKKVSSQLISIFGRENPENMVVASIIANLSSDDQIPNIAWLTQHKGKDYYRQTKKVIDSFCLTLQDLIKLQQYTSDGPLYKLNLMFEKGEINFTEINRYISTLLYKRFYPGKKSFTETSLDNFAYIPGVAESIFSLRKLFIASVTNGIVSGRRKGNKRLIINPGSDIWNKNSSLFDIYGKDVINPIKLMGLSAEDFIHHLAFFVIEGKIASKQSDFSKKQIEINRNGSNYLIILNFLDPNKGLRNIIFHDVKVPAITTLSGTRPKEKTDFTNLRNDAFLDIYFEDILISSIFVPKKYELIE